LGIVARVVSDEEIVDRLILALANEGARILEEGIAQRASDIDVVYCYGYGFPRHRGGPMHYVQARGLTWAVERMTEFQQNLSPDNWSIASLLADNAEKGAAL
jgi:3-hydroxyacyl-CoA dehydrogenase